MRSKWGSHAILYDRRRISDRHLRRWSGTNLTGFTYWRVASLTYTRSRFAELALANRLPTLCGFREFAEAGGLMSYGASFPDGFRRAAHQIDKILKGASPADIPVEQPTRFEFVLNNRTAKALGLEIPFNLQTLADEVIE
jgi:ABC-type uncharacterized transport system substrate-binding protein